jgi:hypothetical protein
MPEVTGLGGRHMLSNVLQSLTISTNVTSVSQTSTSVSTANATSVNQTFTCANGEVPTGLPAPDNEYHATSANQTFTGVNGEVDYFIFDTDINGGNYVVNNYEPGSDWLIFTADQGDSVEISANDGHATYTNNTDSTHGHVDVHAAGDASGISIATITGSLLYL